MEAQVAIILAETYAATLYGVEAARVQPHKIAKLAVVVIDVSKPRNNYHNVDRFFATLFAEEGTDLDPVVQILGRRAMQIRRSASKGVGAESRFKRILMKYVCKHKNGDEWPKWFHDVDSGKAKLPRTYPVPSRTLLPTSMRLTGTTKSSQQDQLASSSNLWCGMG